MNSVIINVSIGYDSNELIDHTDSHRRYASMNDYNYIQIRNNLIDGAKPTWSKHPAALEVINDSHSVMIIDSDAEILETCPRFDDLVRANADYDLFLSLGHSFRLNAGMIILRGGSDSIAVEFLQTIIAERLQIPADVAVPGGDNGHVISLLRRKKFKDKLFILSTCWNNTIQPSDWDYIRHYTGPMRKHHQNVEASTG